MTQKEPRLGTAVFIVNEGKVLLGHRKSKHGKGTWSVVGGKPLFGESPEECAIRETYEETGLTITHPQFLTYTNDLFPESATHFVTFWLVAKHTGQEPKVMEPHKIADFQWFGPKELPQPLFLAHQNLLASNPGIMETVVNFFTGSSRASLGQQ